VIDRARHSTMNRNAVRGVSDRPQGALREVGQVDRDLPSERIEGLADDARELVGHGQVRTVDQGAECIQHRRPVRSHSVFSTRERLQRNGISDASRFGRSVHRASGALPGLAASDKSGSP
jgi:hypothetical protein